MKRHIRRIVPLLLAVILAGTGFWWWNQRADATSAATKLTGSGTIETEDILITSEVGGRVKDLLVDEGQEVAAGQVLARIDTALLDAQRNQARAAVAAAEANLAQLKAGSRPEEIAAAQAQLDQARATRDGAARAQENALEVLKNPQELQVQVAQAQAARDSARRALEQLQAGSRPEDIAAARAALAQVQANAQTVRDQLSSVKTQADTQVQQAALTLTQAQANYAQAKSNWTYVDQTGNDPGLPKQTDPKTGKSKEQKVNDVTRERYYTQYVQAEAALHQAEMAVQQAQVAANTAHQSEVTGIQAVDAQTQTNNATLTKLVNGPTRTDLAAAQTALTNAQRTLDAVSALRANPQQLQAAADVATAQLAIAETQVAQAQAKLELMQAGSRPEQIQAAEAQLAQARAAEQQIEVQLSKTTLTAPRAGVVLSRPIHQGEQAAPGALLMTVGALDKVRLTIYIGETQIGRVRQGQHVDVTVDTFPGRIFPGTITFIASEAQFTPRNVQTQDERATTVFPVRVELANQNHALKPGMPADAAIVE